MKKLTLTTPLVAVALLTGAGAGIASLASAQSSATPAATVSTTTSTPDMKTRGHAPLGGDGNITSINGTTIVMAEEADEGGASYTVDASNATITKNGTASALSALAVGDKIFVKGTTSGTNVVATSISSGHGSHGGHGLGKGIKTTGQ